MKNRNRRMKMTAGLMTVVLAVAMMAFPVWTEEIVSEEIVPEELLTDSDEAEERNGDDLLTVTEEDEFYADEDQEDPALEEDVPGETGDGIGLYLEPEPEDEDPVPGQLIEEENVPVSPADPDEDEQGEDAPLEVPAEDLFLVEEEEQTEETETGSLLGICGMDGAPVTWILNEDGLLKISGEGMMQDFADAEQTPWYEYRDLIRTLIVEDGVESIGDYAFAGCENLADISLPEDIVRVGLFAFSGGTGLTEVSIG